jgi:hypothetical protein
MRRVSTRLLVVGLWAGTAGTAGTVLADEPPDGDPEGTEPAPGSGNDGTVQPPPPPPPADKLERWPIEIIARPLTVREGMLRVQGDLGIASTATLSTDTPPESTRATTLGVVASGGFGVTDKLEVGGSYGLQVKELEAKGPLTVYGALQLVDGPVKAALGASLTYNVGSEVVTASLGVAFQYNLGARLSLFTPGGQLAIGIDPGTTVRFGLPIGVGLQATPKIFASAQTTIASFGLKPSGGNSYISDVTPLSIGAFYSPSNDIDVGAALVTSDAQHLDDAFRVVLTGRLFVK